MAEYSYTTVTGKIGPLLDKIHQVGIPGGPVTHKWLAQYGFSSSNDRSLITVLRQIGFVDEQNVPTETWKAYKAASSSGRKAVLAQAIKVGYEDLYSCYPDAHAGASSDIEAYFRTHVTKGTTVLNKTIQTYRALAGLADFSGAAELPRAAAAFPPAVPDPVDAPAGMPPVMPVPSFVAQGMSVVINIQLAIPETQDARVYDAFFQSLKKHLLS